MSVYNSDKANFINSDKGSASFYNLSLRSNSSKSALGFSTK